MMITTVLAQQTTEVRDTPLYSPFNGNPATPTTPLPDFFEDPRLPKTDAHRTSGG
jgi:hypothetical protein